jgi:HD-like signal output (HDOD) protein
MGKARVSFDSLKAKFSSATALPEIPASALRVVKMIDEADPSAGDLERVISRDPALTAALLKSCSSAAYSEVGRSVTTVRQAIMVVGLKAVRSMAMSLWVEAMVCEKCAAKSLKPARFAQHGQFVAHMARYMFSCRMKADPFTTALSPDEVFAAALLHELPSGLLAIVEPELFDEVAGAAIRLGQSFEYVFETIYEQPVGVLGREAARVWRLPNLMSEASEYLANPTAHPSEPIAFSAIHLADSIVSTRGWGVLAGAGSIERCAQAWELLQADDEMETTVFDLLCRHVIGDRQAA